MGELGPSSEHDHMHLMLPNLAGDDELVEEVKTDRRRFRRLVIGVIAIAVISAAVFTYLDLTNSSDSQIMDAADEADSMAGNLASDSGLVGIGGSTDSHDCLTGAGYSWCDSLTACIRVWETECPPSTA